DLDSRDRRAEAHRIDEPARAVGESPRLYAYPAGSGRGRRSQGARRASPDSCAMGRGGVDHAARLREAVQARRTGRGVRRDAPCDKPVETDPTEAVEEAEPYFPPTDPVLRTDHSGETRIASGFGLGETPAQEPQLTVADAPPDEALEDLVHRALRLDASTAQLH